ncbi:RNase H family protein [Deinococcus sp.]|uniref:RNase H family protein n=1 Tax=Deinococcus sp. TaxID=47478 RepID=UPI003C7B686F
MYHVVLATDGSFDIATGRGGWAAVCALQTRIWTVSGQERQAGNPHLMELRAIVEGLTALTKPCKVLVLTDDQRVLHTLEHGAEGKAETSLWTQVLRAALPHSVRFEWIKGHAGHPLNEQAHALAQLACILPLDADGQPKAPKKPKKKELKLQEREASLELVEIPLQVVPAGQTAALTLAYNGQIWTLHLNGPLGGQTLEGTMAGAQSLQHVAFTALHEGLLALPPACEVAFLCRGASALQSAWKSKSPSKGHREPMRAAKALVTERGHTLNFQEIGILGGGGAEHASA